ncbi:threonine-phosphate decarboxylase CobD [Zhaonella formicivorans]|uniref:threonine-phosphate decarboxylase CobD n=1 Tax=Zhaonella formicivorans TaxID=2528593 RepID=UPI0010D6F55F|nr:threonine-phosphate decarboxylase CobD [Zhaonella formicivorans]
MKNGLPEHGGNLSWAKRHYGRTDFLDFSANINPLGCPKSVFEILSSSWQELLHYPDPEAALLKETLQDYYHLPKEHLLLGNGAVELIYLICLWLHPRRVLILEPTFSEYAKAAKAVKADLSYLPLYTGEEFQLDLRQLEEKLKSADLFFLCNPNNPTGNIWSYEVLHKIEELCLKYRTFLVVDESFIDFVPDKEHYSLRKNVRHNPNLFVLHSLTKFFAIPGLRLGCGLAHPDLIAELSNIKDPWNINVFAQLAGKAAVEDKLFQTETIKYVSREKDFLYNEIVKFPAYHVFPSAANFLLFKLLPGELTSSLLTDSLARQGILVRNCNTFPILGENFIRIAVRKREENIRLLAALAETGHL